MNLTQFSDQIEIAFWMGVVSLARDPRAYRRTLLALVALLVLLTLLLTGFSWAYLHLPARPLTPRSVSLQSAALLPRPENGQKNLLLVVVDRLQDPEPSLEGAWMLIYAPSGLRVTFMPVYPAASSLSRSLEKEFRLAENQVLADSFQQALRAQGLWWDHYLLVDYATLAALVELSGGIEIGEGLGSGPGSSPGDGPGSGRSDGRQVVSLLPIARQNPQTAQELQARIALGICQRFAITLHQASPEAIVELLIDGASLRAARSDLTPADLQASWTSLRNAGGIDCEFPTLIGR